VSEAGALWSAGRYEAVAAHLAPLAEALLSAVQRAGVDLRGARVLDVGCGTGNVALAAAARGAHVTGLDPAERLLAVAKDRARGAGASLELVPGDAQRMPFDDDSFDVVVSCVGVMFAPDHEAAAGEMLRVCRADGVIAVLAWQPVTASDPLAGPVLDVLGHPPAGRPAPTDWGTADHTRTLLGRDRSVTVEQGWHTWHFGDVHEAVRLVLEDSPLHIAVARGLDAEHRALLGGRTFEAVSRCAGDDGVRFRTPYLISTSLPAPRSIGADGG